MAAKPAARSGAIPNPAKMVATPVRVSGERILVLTFTPVPSPPRSIPSTCRDTDTEKSRDNGISSGNGPLLDRGEHEPACRSGDSTGKREHLDTGISLKGR